MFFEYKILRSFYHKVIPMVERQSYHKYSRHKKICQVNLFIQYSNLVSIDRAKVLNGKPTSDFEGLTGKIYLN